MMKKNTFCPVCGYDLGFESWIKSDNNKHLPSFEICPCCGIQFGFHDETGGATGDKIDTEEQRRCFYLGWRLKWINDGMQWSSNLDKPENWDPKKQLENLANYK